MNATALSESNSTEVPTAADDLLFNAVPANIPITPELVFALETGQVFASRYGLHPCSFHYSEILRFLFNLWTEAKGRHKRWVRHMSKAPRNRLRRVKHTTGETYTNMRGEVWPVYAYSYEYVPEPPRETVFTAGTIISPIAPNIDVLAQTFMQLDIEGDYRRARRPAQCLEEVQRLKCPVAVVLKLYARATEQSRVLKERRRTEPALRASIRREIVEQFLNSVREVPERPEMFVPAPPVEVQPKTVSVRSEETRDQDEQHFRFSLRAAADASRQASEAFAKMQPRVRNRRKVQQLTAHLQTAQNNIISAAVITAATARMAENMERTMLAGSNGRY